MRTKDELTAAVAECKRVKSVCDEFDFFNVSNYNKIDTIIDTIENNRDEEYVYCTYPSGDDTGKECIHLHSLWQSGMSALEYLRGVYEITDILPVG